MRIAFISVHGCPMARLGERDTGGMNVLLREVAKALGRKGACVDIFTRYHDPKDPQIVEIGERARVVHLRAGPLDEPKRSLYGHLPTFSRRLDEFLDSHGLRYDVVHSHYWLSGPVGLKLRDRWQAPLVASFHTLGKVQSLVRPGEPDAAQRTATEQRIAERADVLVVGSEHERAELLRLYHAEPGKTAVIPLGFDRELFRPVDAEQARHALGLNGDKIVLFVGRMEPIKGADILVRAVAGLENIEGVRMVVIGGAEGDRELEGLRRMAAELGIGDRIAFEGTVPQDRLPLYYSAADVCVVPSYYETFGLVALEAMACGTPVIGARVGGLKGTIIDGHTGYLVPWHCPEPYTERLEVLLGNDPLRERLGRAARTAVENQTWSGVAERLLEVYQGALLGVDGIEAGSRVLSGPSGRSFERRDSSLPSE